jgi:hypothetical protein
MSEQKIFSSKKEINHPVFNTIIGTVNKNAPSVIYIKGGAFVCPTEEKDGYKEDVFYFQKQLRKIVNEKLEQFHKDLFSNHTICHLNIKQNSMAFGKTSYLTIECHFKQKNSENIQFLPEIKDIVEKTIFQILDQFVEIITGEGYKISKKK